MAKKKTNDRALFIVIFTVVLGLIGFFLGYLIFGRFLGEHMAFKDLFARPQNVLGEIGQSLTGIKTARQNILITTGVGTAVGFLVGVFLRRR